MKRKHVPVMLDLDSPSNVRRSSHYSTASTSTTHGDVDNPEVVSDASEFF